jgi:hypothetical protein
MFLKVLEIRIELENKISFLVLFVSSFIKAFRHPKPTLIDLRVQGFNVYGTRNDCSSIIARFVTRQIHAHFIKLPTHEIFQNIEQKRRFKIRKKQVNKY